MKKTFSSLYATMLLSSLAASAFATTYYVDAQNGNDGGNGSTAAPFLTVAKAVETAHAEISSGTASDGTVILKAGTYGLSANLEIASPITLIGEDGPEATIIDNQGKRVLITGAGAVLSGVTVKNGNGNWDMGANIKMTANGTITNCHVVECQKCYVTWGGGIHATAGLITHCLIANNEIASQRGSAVSLDGNAAMEYCTISGNTNGDTGNGYTVWLKNANASVRNCTFYGNVDKVGLVYVTGTPVVRNCIFKDNFKADGVTPLNICNNMAAITYSALPSRFTAAPNADVIDLKGNGRIFDDPSLDLSDPALPLTYASPCRGAGEDGVDMGATPYATDGKVLCDFTTDVRDGAAPLAVAFTAFTAGIDTSSAAYSWDLDGDGVYETTGTSTPSKTYTENGTFPVSLRVTGAGGQILATSPVSAANTIVVRPSVTYVKADNETPEAPYDTWEKAATTPQPALDALADGGKAIVADGLYELTASVKLFRDVTLESQNGPTNAILLNTVNDRCAILASPGAVISGLSLRNGQQQWSWGGNCYMTDGTVTNCWLTDAVSTTGGCGGQGIYLTGGLLTHSLVARNQQPGQRAAGVCAKNNAIIRNCVISCNTNTATSYGSGLFVSGGNPTVESCTIANNVGGDGGVNYKAALLNCIIWGNTAAGVVKNYASGIEKFVHCCTTPITGATPANNCTDGDPALILADPMLGIGLGSSCIDAGTNQTWMATAGDVAGNARLIKDIVDIGATEYLPSDKLACGFTQSASFGPAPLQVVFTASVSGADPAEVTFRWDFDNDGTDDISALGAAVVTNFFEAGQYSVRLSISDNGGRTAAFTALDAVLSTPSVCYVALGNPNAAAPYTTWETAAADIPTAIAAVVGGGTVLVGDGTYVNSSVIVLDKAVTVKSANGPANCIVTGAGSVNGFKFSAPATVDGLTLFECGQAWQDGGAFYVDVDGSRILNCVIKDCGKKNGVFNGNNMRGSAIASYNNKACVVSNCVFSGCMSQRAEGAAIEGTANVKIFNCLFSDNECRAANGNASAVYKGTLMNCTIARNRNYGGAAVKGCTLTNCILADNFKGASGDTVNNLAATEKFTYACLWPAESGLSDDEAKHVLIADPKFKRPTHGDFHLLSTSPCINVGQDGAWTANDVDLDGETRIFSKAIDLGCYECHTSGGTLLLLK